MTAIPHAAEALTGAFGRFEHASARLLGAAVGAPEEMAVALVDMKEAKLQAKAAVSIIRFADEMWDALIEIGRERK